MHITFTGWMLLCHQTPHRNWVAIKVALSVRKVWVETHGSRVGFVHPYDGYIYSGPSRWNVIQLACKHVTGSQGITYHGNDKRVLISNKVELGMQRYRRS